MISSTFVDHFPDQFKVSYLNLRFQLITALKLAETLFCKGDFFCRAHSLMTQSIFATLQIKQNKMISNPQLHYLSHMQNTSSAKLCFKFAKAPRFTSHKRTYDRFYQRPTDFNYQPRLTSEARSCSFGYGSRPSLSCNRDSPSPNQYNIRKFSQNGRSTTMAFGRQRVIFGTIAVEINKKAKLPAPGTYEWAGPTKNRKFTLRKRFKNDKGRQNSPGPGEYSCLGINKEGKYPVSTVKNVRYVFVDSYKQQKKAQEPTGPAFYQIQNSTSNFSSEKFAKMKSSSCKPFGTQKRKGPEQTHRLFVPGPGLYETFSSFGKSKLIRARRKTEY